MNDNSYAGREYMSKMIKENIKFDVVTIGKFPEYDEIEESRCDGQWTPPSQKELFQNLDVVNFKSLKSNDFLEFISNNVYNLAIQGGTGIIKNQVISKFNYGILNFHPGDLPNYKGCSAPEWQLYENKDIISTCHFIDEGIDTGPILDKKKLNVCKNSYYSFRASIYPLTSCFLVDTLKTIMKNKSFLKTKITQSENSGSYRKYIGDEKINELKFKFND